MNVQPDAGSLVGSGRSPMQMMRNSKTNQETSKSPNTKRKSTTKSKSPGKTGLTFSPADSPEKCESAFKSPDKLPSMTPTTESWTVSPTKALVHPSELSLGDLIRSNTGYLLQVLDTNLKEILAVQDSQLINSIDPIPLFPEAVSLKDLNDFYGMMECEIFFTYMNLFLNLPVFGRRMSYKTGVRQFSLDPPLKKRRGYRIDHGMITSWVVVHRLPYFLQSSLYLEYRFCYELLNDLTFDGRSLHLIMELKGPIGINRFRIFLDSRGLTKLVSFWMDCEQFHLQRCEKSRKESFNAIEILYLKHGSRFELPEVIRKGIMNKIEKESVSSIVEVMVHGVPLLERIKKKEVEKIRNFEVVGILLKTAQDEVMTFLRNYWMPRYFTRNGQPYTDNKQSGGDSKMSHLIWGHEHRVPPAEPTKMIGFCGQAPQDFESVAEKLQAQQSMLMLSSSPGAHDDMFSPLGKESVWNLDLSKKPCNAKRKEKKILKKFTLFEQARKKSMAVTRQSDMFSGMGRLSNDQSYLASIRSSMQSRGISAGSRRSSSRGFGSGFPLLEPLGVDFSKNAHNQSGGCYRMSTTPTIRFPSQGGSPNRLSSVLKKQSRSKTLCLGSASSTSSGRKSGNSLSPDNKVLTKRLSNASIPEEEDDAAEDVELLKIIEDNKSRNSIILPTLSKSPNTTPNGQLLTPVCSKRSNAVLPILNENEECWDPYSLLEIINPDLLRRPTVEQLNTRKWILGALAASCLAGNPLKDFLSTYSFTNMRIQSPTKSKEFPVPKKKENDPEVNNDEKEDSVPSELEEDELEDRFRDKMEVALNNLDCWQRIERIRSTSGTSHAGRRAEEITNAGGWGGLGAPTLLPNYHSYLASLSGELLEAHLEPFIEMKYISKTYLVDPEKLNIDVEVMNILYEMFKGRSINDSWFALLQEHNVTILKSYILKYLVWDDEKLLMSCAPSKQTCQYRVHRDVKSAQATENAVFCKENETDFTMQFVFSPRSDQVWLSLFALEVSGYRPAEIYFPPMPTTTKAVGCSVDEEEFEFCGFQTKERREVGVRPKSTLMTDSQSNLRSLQGCRASPNKRNKLLKNSAVRTVSRNDSSVGNYSQMTIISDESETSLLSGHGSKTSKMRKDKAIPKTHGTFKQVLADQTSFSMFMKFLELNMADENEAPLINLWNQVEIMKSYTNFKSRKEKALSIHRKYLFSGNNAAVLKEYMKAHPEMCTSLIDLAERKNISPNMMVNAQTAVCKILEDRWWVPYKNALGDDKMAKALLSARTRDTVNANINCGKDYRAHIRYMWGNFTFDLINFQQGLENPQNFIQFRNFLRKTTTKLNEMNQRRVSKENGVATNINGVNVYVDRLVNDLYFFLEITRWISLKCGMSQNKKGALNKESEVLLLRKAEAIAACYLRSAIPPRVCVNLPEKIISDIERRLDDTKKFNRCVFYHAILHMITILLPFWKKFCFILSARGSSKDASLIQTVSGHAISEASMLGDEEAIRNSLHEFQTLNRHIDNVKKAAGKSEVKGLRKRLGSGFQRRDGVALAGNASMAQDQDGSGITGRIVCQYSLMLNHCCMKHESGMEVPHDFESLLTPWSEEIEYLKSPLPRIRSKLLTTTPPSKPGRRESIMVHNKAKLHPLHT